VAAAEVVVAATMIMDMATPAILDGMMTGSTDSR